MVLHHSRCSLESFVEDELVEAITSETGARPPFRLGAYRDVDADVRSTVATLRSSPFVDGTDVRGFVFDVDDGSIREVTP